ncbi:hypothetical protein J2S43_006164 [Catenuloplanes nepalensis]|uniref:2-phospho-L-lactate guanylyltransferase n=1 Tax=Catenuloplanes nepalensis TaxID=587533 RepID=A0ABT9N1S8_9ACTN|nr:hypothetical protein [Catenuloplanes nepalensis]MDP9797652.1 hypothetical protein [Catenuloplanes nepalensis]
MTRRVAVAVLVPVEWAPPGMEPGKWRAALAEDVVDLLRGLAQVDAAIAVTGADRALADGIRWPGMPVYEVARLDAAGIFAAAAADGYEQAALVAGDAPNLPGLTVGKLLRPLTTRPLAVARADAGPGLVGVAANLPVPPWLPDFDLDSGDPGALRRAAERSEHVGSAPEWRRLRTPDDLHALDPAVEGWDVTRALLGG